MTAIFCPECGSENEDDVRYCLKCGTRINQNDSDAFRDGLGLEDSFYETFSRGSVPGLALGAIIVFIGIMFSVGDDFGSTIGDWGGNFGEFMGNWGSNFGEFMGNWGENFGRFFADFAVDVGTTIGASMAIAIGFIIVAYSLREMTRG